MSGADATPEMMAASMLTDQQADNAAVLYPEKPKTKKGTHHGRIINRMVGDTSEKKTKEGDRMIRGTTPTLTFTIPFSSELIQSLYITFVQNGREVLTLTEKDCSFSDSTVTAKLTQEQTLRFNHSHYAEIQARILTKDGTALASNICCCTINRILKDGEI